MQVTPLQKEKMGALDMRQPLILDPDTDLVELETLQVTSSFALNFEARTALSSHSPETPCAADHCSGEPTAA